MKSIIALITILSSVGLAQQENSRSWMVNPTSLISLISDTYKPDSGSSKNLSETHLFFEFGKNFQRWEFGPSLSYHTEAECCSDSTSAETAIGGYFRYNFIENVAGNMLIPFARVALLSVNYQNKTPDYSINGSIVRLRTGVTYFPTNDFVALEGALEYSDRSYSGESKYKYTGLNLKGSFVVYF